jgi:hypothetical protein
MLESERADGSTPARAPRGARGLPAVFSPPPPSWCPRRRTSPPAAVTPSTTTFPPVLLPAAVPAAFLGVGYLAVSQRLGSSVDGRSDCRHGEHDESRRTKCRESVAHCVNSSRPQGRDAKSTSTKIGYVAARLIVSISSAHSPRLPPLFLALLADLAGRASSAWGLTRPRHPLSTSTARFATAPPASLLAPDRTGAAFAPVLSAPWRSAEGQSFSQLPQRSYARLSFVVLWACQHLCWIRRRIGNQYFALLFSRSSAVVGAAGVEPATLSFEG